MLGNLRSIGIFNSDKRINKYKMLLINGTLLTQRIDNHWNLGIKQIRSI